MSNLPASLSSPYSNKPLPLLFFGREYTFIVSAKPHQCPGCRAQHYFFINRDGRTHCAECDLNKTAPTVPFDPRDPWSYLGGA